MHSAVNPNLGFLSGIQEEGANLRTVACPRQQPHPAFQYGDKCTAIGPGIDIELCADGLDLGTPCVHPKRTFRIMCHGKDGFAFAQLDVALGRAEVHSHSGRGIHGHHGSIVQLHRPLLTNRCRERGGGLNDLKAIGTAIAMKPTQAASTAIKRRR